MAHLSAETIPTADQWGPFRCGLEQGERRARLRMLAALVHVLTGPRGARLVGLLQAAETEPRVLVEALGDLNRMAPLDKRRIWASYAELTAPTRPRSRSSNLEDRR
ncbi:hypothetical protein [Methylobacterium sp. J-070]|uniref:hypothetical protein n=1 Tax=Methylobacterium sp. J-070 TaxID=2836650 RepID=UPI001FB928CE|nr:hypothetical protein [Methylobacterium sp. J-070]MCJ2048525.1 hypothetical protein [Methylobacterium sp. J-070]